MATKKDGVQSYDKAQVNEPLFVLRAKDRSSPRIVLEWIIENFETATPAKLQEAFDCALQMRAWQFRKTAD